MEVMINMQYGSYTMNVQFGQYAHNERTALIFEDEVEGGYIDGSINIPDAPVPDNDHIIVKNYSENIGLEKELIRLGLIEEYPVDYAFSGFISAPVYKLTDKALAIRDEQFKAQTI